MNHRSCAVLVALLLASCAVFGDGDETREKLAGFLFRARRYHEAGRNRQALDQIERGLELAPKDEKLRTLQGFIYLDMARTDPTRLEDALTLFEELSASGLFRSPSIQARLGLGMTLQGLAQRDAAYANQLEQALRDGTIPPDRVAATQEALPKVRARGVADLERAAHIYDWVLRRETGHVRALYHQGLTQAQLENNSRALEYLKTYIEVASRRRRTLVDQELRMTMDKKEEDRLWQQIRTLEAREKESRGLTANILYKQGEYAAALAELDALLKMDPELTHEYFNRARCHARLGNRGEALRDYKRFVGASTLPREDPRIREALEFLGEANR